LDGLDAPALGKLLYVNALYHRALLGMAEVFPGDAEPYLARAALLRRKIDLLLWPEPGSDHGELLQGVGYPHGSTPASPPGRPGRRRDAMREDRRHYLSHVDGGRYVDECDVLGNVLAVLYGIAAPERARLIMEFLHRSAAGVPYPMPTYTRSFEPGDRWGMYRHDLERFQDERWRTPRPLSQRRGLALHRCPLRGRPAAGGDGGRGRRRVHPADRANRLNRASGPGWGFHEWIDARTGEPEGAPGQSWSAGAYLLAAEVLSGRPSASDGEDLTSPPPQASITPCR